MDLGELAVGVGKLHLDGAKFVRRNPPQAVASKSPDQWGVQLVGSSSDVTALAARRPAWSLIA
jgi:hypothetical protein